MPDLSLLGYHTCTPEAPWNASMGDRAIHPRAESRGECSDSCCDYWYCPICGHHFKTEVGQ